MRAQEFVVALEPVRVTRCYYVNCKDVLSCDESDKDKVDLVKWIFFADNDVELMQAFNTFKGSMALQKWGLFFHEDEYPFSREAKDIKRDLPPKSKPKTKSGR